MIIADANVWIDYFNKPASRSGEILGDLLNDDQVVLVGVVLTEILRGVQTDQQRETLMETLDAVPYLEMERAAWVKAGSIAQTLDATGQPLAVPDVIIAALAVTAGHELLTRDKHFERIPGLRLYQPEGDPS